MFAYVMQGAILGLSAAAAPGPFQAFLLSQTARNGWRRTLPAAAAPLFSDGPIIALMVFLLTQTPDWFLRALRLAGGVFILYLAYGAYATYRARTMTGTGSPEPARYGLAKAVLMNALNPNPYLFWGVIAGPILLEGWRRSMGWGMGFLVGFYGALVSAFAGLVLLFAAAGQLGEEVRRALNGFSALALFLFGLYQLWQGISPYL